MRDLYEALTRLFTPAGVDIDPLAPGNVKICAWRGCNSLITTDDPGLDFCGHTCQRKWTCEVNGIEWEPDHSEFNQSTWDRTLRGY